VTVEIPIQNIYFLLCYAWDKLAEKDIVGVDPIESTSLIDLFGRVLATGTSHLVRRGFDRGDVMSTEWTSRPKGRLLFDESPRRFGMTATLPCGFDELSYDVLHNRILKATMRRLILVEMLSRTTTETLARMCRLLSDVDDIELTSRLFGQVQLYRSNSSYDFLLKVCELIHRNLLVSEASGHGKFRDFMRDEGQMAIVYEQFIRNFYRRHTSFRVKREDIRWQWVPADDAARRLLPKMQTDVNLTSSHPKIIIECKYSPEAVKMHYDAEKLRAAHLYQVHAYLNNLSTEALANSCEVMLLYPGVGVSLAASYTDKGRRVSIRTIDLNQPWQRIHEDLLALVA
jgi:5-methylcytosine-specific restriction enzyme subunit McrC